MVRLTRIYTRGGDKGKTSLGDGSRVAKHELRVEAYGTVDEANSVIGLARLFTADPQWGAAEADGMLARIQNDLFDLGADLCVPPAGEEMAGGEAGGEQAAGDDAPPTRHAPLRVVQAQVDRLEAEIDAVNARLAPLESFILPGGTPGASHLHHARTVVRRAERLVSQLAESENVNPLVLVYLNRLSDHLFVLARHLNADGTRDVLWIAGANR